MVKFSQAFHLGQVAVPATESHDTKHETQEQLQKVVSKSHETICEATTVFPFTLFPDSIIVDRTKVTIINRLFFYVDNHVTINLEDILNVTSSVGPFFGSLQIHTKFFDPGKPYEINFLWRHDTQRIERILQGYHIAMKKKIDMSEMDVDKLAKMLDELGRGK